MASTEQIKQAMLIRHHAAILLTDHEDQPVDACEEEGKVR